MPPKPCVSLLVVIAVISFLPSLLPAATPSSLAERFASIAASIHGRVGVAAELLETGERVALHGDQPFPMQSVYKFPIAMAVHPIR